MNLRIWWAFRIAFGLLLLALGILVAVKQQLLWARLIVPIIMFTGSYFFFFGKGQPPQPEPTLLCLWLTNWKRYLMRIFIVGGICGIPMCPGPIWFILLNATIYCIIIVAYSSKVHYDEW